MTDWAEIGKSIVPGESVVTESERILRGLSAGNEQQLQARVEELLGRRFLGPDMVKAMLKTQDIGVIAPLPKNIVKVLNMQSPIHEQGVLVHEGHLLGYVPDMVSLRGLSEACGGRAGGKFHSEWFLNENHPIADLTLSKVGHSGHWVLIPNELPPGTERKGFDASAETLKKDYGQIYSQADVISFTTMLLLNDFNDGDRWYPCTYGWCRDPRFGDPLGSTSSFGRSSDSAFYVGRYYAGGVGVGRTGPDKLAPHIGCGASWDFGT